MKLTPRFIIEATKPPKSHTTPPPRLMIKLDLSNPFTNNISHIFLTSCKDFDVSPGQISITQLFFNSETDSKRIGKHFVLVFESTITNIEDGHAASI